MGAVCLPVFHDPLDTDFAIFRDHRAFLFPVENSHMTVPDIKSQGLLYPAGILARHYIEQCPFVVFMTWATLRGY